MGVVAIDWVDDRSDGAMELRAVGLNVQSGPHKPALQAHTCRGPRGCTRGRRRQPLWPGLGKCKRKRTGMGWAPIFNKS